MSVWTIADAVWRQSKGVFAESQNTLVDGVRGASSVVGGWGDVPENRV